MANKKSSKKRIRTNSKRAIINSNRKARVRTFTKKVIVALESGNKTEAEKALRVAESEMMKAAGKGAIAKKAASRKVSRLTKKIANIK